jgi:hypothetical protein
LADKTAKKELRRQRRQEEKTRRVRAARRESLFIWGGLGAIVIVTGFIVFQTINPAGKPGMAHLDQGNQHLSSETESHAPYNTVPPTSGPHMGNLASWGIHEEPIIDELQIHNLEDGGVIIQYDCPDDCPELKSELTGLFSVWLKDPSLANPTTGEVHLVLAPHAGIRNASGGKPIALTAWTRLQYFDTVDTDGMLAFIRAYINIDHHVRGIG